MTDPKNLTATEVLARTHEQGRKFESKILDVLTQKNGPDLEGPWLVAWGPPNLAAASITNADRKQRLVEVLEGPMSDAMLTQLESVLGIKQP